ncbi:3-dehydroquinate synthase [Armatimonas sp.]|uniref:3-dehydroquinate synthase n=1 Tax=Armatimonas sp. TaxID=1872638 RepID=UPI00286A1441|nr:3-dehydroquinate synthase [Armatimonas sp.]
MSRVPVALSEGRDYEIHIAAGSLATLGQHCAATTHSSRAVILTQPSIARHWETGAAQSLERAGFQVTSIHFPVGERYKNLTTITRLYDALYQLTPALDRKTLIVALGGGVVGDMAGYVAATYLRGLDYVQVPTTLLAMVDSSVGGKTGVDFREGKNLIGAFHQPRCVVIDPTLLQTLPRREIRSGLAEVVKYGVIQDPVLLAKLREQARLLLRGDADAIAAIVERSCQLKAEVVTADEREETGLRAILNFGHTIGHALESATKYRRYKHGEAVAIGMLSAALIGEQVGVTPSELTQELRATLLALGLPTALPDDVSDETLIALTARDKKAEAGEARFILAKQMGQVELMIVPTMLVRAGLEKHRKGFD